MKKILHLIIILSLCFSVTAEARMLGDKSNIHIGKGVFRKGNGFPSGMLFMNIYDDNINADYSVGSGTATFAASRDATHPATYFDSAGVMQKTETSNAPRYNYGYYDTTGYHAFTQAGVMINGASTNYLTYSIFSSDAGAGLATGWSVSETLVGSETTTLVDISSTFNVGTTVNSQRIAYTGNAGDANDGYYIYQDTAAASFAQNDNVTVSVWIKGEATVGTLKMSFCEYNNLAAAGTWHQSSSFLSSISSTEWRRFTYSATCADVDVDHLRIAVYTDDVDANETFDIQIACIQVEKLPFATSFIPTTTAALTRNAETLKYPMSGNRSAAVESCVVKVAPSYANTVIPNGGYLTTTDTKDRRFYTISNDVYLYPNVTDTVGSAITDIINDTWTANAEMTLGYNVQSTGNPNASGYYNGVADGTDTNTDFTSPTWGTYFWVGSKNNGTLQLNGTIFSIAFFDRVLTDSEQLFMYNKDWRTLDADAKYTGK